VILPFLAKRTIVLSGIADTSLKQRGSALAEEWRSSMQTLIVVDAQNEFSPLGQRPVHTHAQALETIHQRVEDARQQGRHIAWVGDHNVAGDALSGEPPAFVPGTWGAEFSLGLGPQPGRAEEVEFQKSVFGAFTGTSLGSWLESLGCDDVLIVGFFTH